MLYDEIESWSEKFLMSQKFTMVGCHGFSSRNSDARWRRKRQRQLARKVKAYSKMAANNNSASTSNKLCLRHFGMEDETERGDRFWNTNSVEMKFSAEKEWLRRVRFTENNPNYGMRDLDPVLEELTGNKLELVGPLVDAFLKEIGLSINAKLARSRMTGLMAPITLFMPYDH